MLKHLRFDIFELQETKLPVRLINTINERRLVRGHETPLTVKWDIEDASSELDNGEKKLILRTYHDNMSDVTHHMRLLCQVIYSQFGLAIHQNDHQTRRRFVEWAQNEIAVVPDFHKRILFSDEAHFWLNGYVNKQNCRIWSEANPQVYVETPLHPEKLTVWCALWAGGIIGPFFKNDEGHNVTVNGDRYRAMITNFFIPELNNHDVQELWFQQDGATCHTARATIDLLKDLFGDRLISRFGPVNWPPRSCDLTPLDYFLWGYVKSLVYADKPQALDHLEDNIRHVYCRYTEKKRHRKLNVRLDYIRASRGSHMPEIIFKIQCYRRSLHHKVVEIKNRQNKQRLGSGECGQHPCPTENRRACRKGPVQHGLYVDVSGDNRVQWSDETRQLLYVLTKWEDL
ncbi:transposase [Trichonephila clavipes]|nr:transposase [Trichonephila clavipes]